MDVLEIKGVRIGEGRPKAIVSLMDESVDALLARASRAVEAGVDCLEWRVDCFPQARDAEAVASTCQALAEALPATPLIVTLRSKGQGGKLDLPAGEHVALCRALIAAGSPDFVDIELGLGDQAVRELVAEAHARGVRAIVSHHDFSGTPEVDEMVATIVHLAELGADIPKLAVYAHRAQDSHALMRATALAREQVDVPLLTMAMGSAGQTSRLTGEVFGSALTFCALGVASAPGQVELAQALATMDALHRSR